MVRLYVMRHGKSDWDAVYTHDRDRPLADRGVQAAKQMGRFLTRLGEPPELVVTSSATRAATTVDFARRAGGWDCPIRETPDLYTNGAARVLAVIRRHGVEAGADSMLLAGHEPWCSELVGELVGSALVHFPTAAIARVDLPIGTWSEIRFGEGTLRWLVTPKLLRGAGETA